ncbi:uncharacterized protein LOC135258535 [Anguilla rostrata]|uniref:uncharacterized protein LOC135258535 n=1 Tax=Anguilla rostrata TaxID=7938 RepID=UPI0030D0C7E9
MGDAWKCISYQKCISSFKKAHITPLLKKPTLDPSVIQNYRPVSLLPFLSKTLERAASNQLSAYFSENNLLDPHQSGFRPGHSTETALLSVSESLHAARAASLSSVLILLDLSAAFDTVDHSTLLSSLAATGIRGTVLDWIESYLSDRSFQVAWAGPRPHLRLPEGHTELDGQSPPEAQPGKDGANLYSCSILSPPRLFHFLRGHRSDIITLRQESRSDDGQQAVPLQQHCSSNPGMQIFPIQHPQNPPLSHHLLNPAPGPSNGSIRLDYCNSLLAGLPASATRPLQLIQNAAARLVFNLPRHSHVTPLLTTLHWLPVIARIKFKTLVLAYQAVKGSAPAYLQKIFKPYMPARSLRSATSGRLAPPPLRTCTSRTRLLSVLAPRWWNDLPVEVRTAETVTLFKRRLKTHLFRLHLSPSLPPL